MWNITSGFSRQDFVEIINFLVEKLIPNASDDLRQKAKANMNMIYTPWPYTDDLAKNREQVGYVSQPNLQTTV